MACAAQSIINAAVCDLCSIPVGMVDYVELALLCALRDGDTVACDPQSLINEANCLLCQIPAGAVGYAKLGILCDILNGGGSGGTQRVFFGSFGDPNGNVTADGAALYYDTDGSLWGHYSAGNNNTNWNAIVA